MRRSIPLFLLLAAGQALPQPPAPVSSPQEVRAAMGIPSTESLRGQQDTLGYASTAEQMARVWALAEAAPAPESLGSLPAPGIAGAILPHDDYLYAGPVCRRVAPLLTARTVVLVGVFHKYRRFGVRDRIIFDTYPAWRSPEGPIPVSSLRERLLTLLPEGECARDAASHDSEHSLEALAYWLRHQRPDLEILPILVPAASFERFQAMASHLGSALAVLMKRRGLWLGKDVAIVISSDGTHYGSDFHHTPFGPGGVAAYIQTLTRDRELLRGPLAGPLSPAKARTFFEACVDPERPDEYRATWCGRFSIPFGMLLLEATAKGLGEPAPRGLPLFLGSSVDTPGLPVKPLGMGTTAPANLYHFVTHPAAAWVSTKP